VSAKHLCALSITVSIVVSCSAALAICPDSDCNAAAETILVRKNCTGLQNCFESVAKMTGRNSTCAAVAVTNDSTAPYGQIAKPTNSCKTNGWLWSTWTATQGRRIDVGPGDFESFVCPFATPRLGHVTVRGAGRDQTRFLSTLLEPSDPQGTALPTRAIDIYGCDELVFSELTAEGSIYGVRWLGGGEATWSRVDMIANPELAAAPVFGTKAGWSDGCFAWDIAQPSVHFIYDSRSIARNHNQTATGTKTGYLSDCSETYYFGGALLSSSVSGGGTGLTIGAFPNYAATNEPPSFHGFNVQIVVHSEQGSGVGIDAQSARVVNLQDGGIDVDATGPSGTATGVRTQGGDQVRLIVVPIDADDELGSGVDEQNL
jgi:hypothetical protein